MSIPSYLPEESSLGKKTAYDANYNPEKLFPIPRKNNRLTIGIDSATKLPFFGYDVWNHYEASWLNEKGKPMTAIAEIIYSCETPTIIESKSMKLYFNTFNNTSFKDVETIEAAIKKDLEERLSHTDIHIRVTPLCEIKDTPLLARLEGICIDELDIACSVYHTNPAFLTTEETHAQETLYTDLFKSNCPVTNQPDWCSIQIQYEGKKINREGLLKYIVSFRNDNEFHEQGIEKVFMHLMQYCQPNKLTVYGRSTRRGGLDINSIRSTEPVNWQKIPNTRLCRQ